MRPLFNDFAHAGVPEALLRGLASLRARVTDLPELPSWLWEPDFVKARAAADPWQVGVAVKELRRAERFLRTRVASRTPMAAWAAEGAPGDGTPAIPSWAADDAEAQKRMVVALGRLALGAAVEAVLAEKAIDLLVPGATAESTGCDGAAARVYQDAFLASVWTSAHAQYVSYVQQGVEEPPGPSVFTVPSALSEFDHSDLFARRSCQRQCPKGALPLLQILSRCTNPGARGWDTLLETALKDSMPSRVVVATAVTIALSGMHPFLHPALRPPWADRMRIQRTAAHTLTDTDVRPQLVATAASTKEAVRRLLATTVAVVPATTNAFAQVKHPIGLLPSPPLHLPHAGLEAAMATFVRAGILTTGPNPKPYTEAIAACFRPPGAEDAPVAIQWELSWLGALGKGTSATHQKVALTALAADLWSTAFRANFLLFWAHSAVHKMRASRLDTPQHTALHEMNGATRLVRALDTDSLLAAQRAALQHPSSALLTMEEAAQLLGVPNVKCTMANGGAKNAHEALEILALGGAKGAAQLLAFSRVAWLCDELLTVELGPRSKRLQLKALYARLRRTDYNETTATPDVLPVHATCLHACMECKRVANALLDHTFKPGLSFTELGVSSSMLCTECVEGPARVTHIRCAKRSSAALRTALNFEEAMALDDVESKDVEMDSVHALLGESSNSGETGVAARVRRDAKNALEQRAVATACGELPMLNIPLLGRAVRLWNNWYAICSLCGAMMRVLPEHRYGGEICCGRCEPTMLGLPAPAPSERLAAVCRYCSAKDTIRSASRWKMCKSPLDTFGENATLPSVLRTCYYCPAHWRTWLPAAHRVLQTKVILSHLAHNAKPVFSAEKEKVRTADELGFAAPVQGKKRRRGKKGAKANT